MAALCGLIASEVSVLNKAIAQEATHKNLVYATIGAKPRHLDLYLSPHGSAEKPQPVIVWIHGGAWRSGSKEGVPVLHWLKRGFSIASIDYRLSPEAPFPAQVEDIKAAIRFLRARSETYRLDPQRMVIAGASAGGHLAALVGVSNRLKDLEGNSGEHLGIDSSVQGIVSFYGASNLQSILDQSTEFGKSVRVPALDLLLGGQPIDKPLLARLASPVVHVDATDPPLWLVHGDADPQMPIEQSKELAAVYSKLGLSVDFEVLPGSKHGGAEFFEEKRLNRIADEILRSGPFSQRDDRSR